MIEVLACGPAASVQDGGRPGHLSLGLARGGAADRLALEEAAALLGAPGAAVETAGAALRLRVDAATAIAFTGAPMDAEIDGRRVAWHASHDVPAGAVLSLRPTGRGVYSYVTPAGGIASEPVMGSRAMHRMAGLGRPIEAGDRLSIAGGGTGGLCLQPPPDRFDGGVLRCVATPQTPLFGQEAVARFEAASFRRDARGDRQGVRLALDGPGFAVSGQLALLSDFVLPGDVQMTGDGVPYVLGPDAQTTGGYPRIAHVVAADLPRALQAPPGAALRFAFVTLAQARAAAPGRPSTGRLRRDPAAIADLGRHQLIGGVVDARE